MKTIAIRKQSAFRRQQALTFGGVAVCIGLTMLTGCKGVAPAHRPSIEELIQVTLDEADTSREFSVATAENRMPTEVELVSPLPAYVASETVVDTPTPPSLVLPEEIPAPIETISEDFVETEVREALAILADEAGVDLVLDEKVVGVVNTQINELTIDEAIEKTLMPLGLVAKRHGDRFIIAPPDPASPLFSYVAERVEYRPMHVEPKTLISTVPTSMQQYVKSIEGTNIILIEAPARISKQITDRFSVIDQPVPQVVLEAIICVVSPDSGFQLGLDWQHAVELNGKSALKLGASGLALNGAVSRPGVESVFSDFATTSAFVKLLCENGYLTIRASPHVMAKDGEKANIAINRETFFSIQPFQSGTDASNSSFFFQQNIQKVESGITLDITPTIRGDLVTVHIEKAEVSEDIRTANTELALNPFPIINRRSVSTTVHVKDGKTIVIGGLVQRETVDRTNRVPGLSNIPLLGYLFESQQRQTREADVVIFISPRIVKPVVME